MGRPETAALTGVCSTRRAGSKSAVNKAGNALLDARQVPPAPARSPRSRKWLGPEARAARPYDCTVPRPPPLRGDSRSVFTFRAKGVRDAHGQGALGADERIERLPDKEGPIGEVMAILETSKQSAFDLLFASHGE